MKKLFCSLFILSFSLSIAQEIIKEPDFVGEAFILQANDSLVKLDKEKVKVKTKTGVSVFITGYGNIKTKLNVAGCCSNVIINPENEIRIIVRAIDNNMDPLEIIQVFKLSKKKSKRTAELASYGTFSGSSDNNLDNIEFSAEKYGENSYLLTISNYDRDSQYGLIVKNNNLPIQATSVISTFAIQ
jgi:hypothetical protein